MSIPELLHNQKVIAEINSEYAVVVSGKHTGKIVVLDSLASGKPQFISKAALTAKYGNRIYWGHNRSIPAVPKWMTHPDRRNIRLSDD